MGSALHKIYLKTVLSNFSCGSKHTRGTSSADYSQPAETFKRRPGDHARNSLLELEIPDNYSKNGYCWFSVKNKAVNLGPFVFQVGVICVDSG